jgi:hypothetical protein
MADDDKSFKELLTEAPLAAGSDTVTMIGALARATEPNKFVLALANGGVVTLETKAVKSFTRLGSAIGVVLVQLELDAKLVPKDLHLTHPGGGKLPISEWHHAPPPTLWESIQIKPPNDATGLNPVGSGVPVGGGGLASRELFARPEPEPSPWVRIAGGIAPFALATPHQAQAETLAALMQRYAVTSWTDTGPPDTPVTGLHDAGTPFWHDGLTGPPDVHIQY